MKIDIERGLFRMKKIKYRITLAITSLFLLLATLSINTIPIQAATSVIKGDFISGGGITTTYRNSPSWIWSLSIGMNSITVGGETAYCLEPARSVSTNNATSTTFDKLTQVNVGSESRPDAPKITITKSMKEKITLLANYGYGYPGHNTIRYQWATQKLIWDTLGFSTSGGSNVTTEENNILALISRHKTVPSWDSKITKVKTNEVVTLTDSFLNDYDVNSSYTKGLSVVEKTATQLKVKVTNPNNAELWLKKKQGIKEGTSLVWSDGTSQKVLVAKVSDPIWVSHDFAPAYGDLDIGKKDTSGNMIPNTTFELSRNKTSIYGAYTTGSNGKVSVKDLEEGTYYVREKSVPAPLIIDTTWKTINITAGKTTSFSATNAHAMGQIEVTKKSSHGDLIKATHFEVYNSSNKVVDTIITNNKGYGISVKLPLGKYTVTETKVPGNLVLDRTPISIELKYKDQVTEVVVESTQRVNDYQRSDLTLNKVENEWDTLQTKHNSKPLNGAAIELYAQTDVYEGSKLIYLKDTLVGKEVTNKAGQVQFHNLPIGEYYAKEVIAPEGYLLFDGVWNISILYQNDKVENKVTTTEATLTNQIAHGRSKIHKTGKGGTEFLKDAVFGLFKEDGTKLGEYTTDKKGEIISPDLRFGSYYWQELKAPKEYYLDNTKHHFTITLEDHDQTLHIPLVNEYIEMKLQVIKKDVETDKPLKDAIFEIRDSNDEVVTFEYIDENFEVQVQSQLITNDKGIAATRGFLKYGDYTLVEVQAPKGYIRQEPISFTINEKTEFIDFPVMGKTKVQNISNQPTTTEVIKLSENTGEPLEDAHLQLIHKQSKEVILDWVTDGTPVVFKGLHIDETYILKEVNPPEGYFIASSIEFKVNETVETHVITMLNELIPKIKTQALFEDETKINKPSEEMTVIDTVTFKDLIKGKEYRIDGQLLDVETQDIIATSTLTFTPEETDGTVNLSFTFDGSKLYGKTLVIFEDLYRDDRLLATHSELTDKDQTVYLPEIKTSASTSEYHHESNEVITINDVLSYKALEVGKEYTAVGWIMTKDNIQLLDLDGHPIYSDVNFIPTESSGQIEVSFEVPLEALEKGDFVIFEELYLEEKLIAEHKDLDDKEQTISMVNLVIIKKDKDTKELLKGVEFTLYDNNNNPITSKMTDESGTVKFLVPKGKYSIKETKALDGYILSSKTLKFKVRGNEENHEIVKELYNKNIPLLPPTGEGLNSYQLAVIAISTGVIISSLIYLRKKDDEDEL